MFAVPANTIARPEAAAHSASSVPATNTPPAHPVRVALRFAAERERWRHLLRYDPDQRFAVLVESDPTQEVWLLSWLPGQRAGLHDHGSATGAFTVVNGVLTETVARRADSGRPLESMHTLEPGQSRVFGPGYVHEVANTGSDPAVSLHVYRAGGRDMRPYHLDPVDGPVRD